ncbi:hypothetical protein V8C37DRAFT_297037 [Trichoderma ceciliae]
MKNVLYSYCANGEWALLLFWRGAAHVCICLHLQSNPYGVRSTVTQNAAESFPQKRKKKTMRQNKEQVAPQTRFSTGRRTRASLSPQLRSAAKGIRLQPPPHLLSPFSCFHLACDANSHCARLALIFLSPSFCPPSRDRDAASSTTGKAFTDRRELVVWARRSLDGQAAPPACLPACLPVVVVVPARRVLAAMPCHFATPPFYLLGGGDSQEEKKNEAMVLSTY